MKCLLSTPLVWAFGCGVLFQVVHFTLFSDVLSMLADGLPCLMMLVVALEFEWKGRRSCCRAWRLV